MLADIRLRGIPEGPLPAVGTKDTELEPTSTISTAAATELAELKLDPTWSRDVWLLWARSRYRRARAVAEAGLLETKTIAPADVPATSRTELPPELRLSVDTLAELHPVGSAVHGVVTSVNDEIRRAWVRIADGAPASMVAPRHTNG